MSYSLYGNVIVDSSNSTALGGTLTISNSCKTSSLNNRASIAFAVADISYGTLKKGLLNNNIDTADARITAIIDKVSPTVGTGLSVSVSSNHANPPVEALRVQSNGNVGIGTQTPQFPLDVNGNIRLGTGTTGNIRFGTTGVGTTQAGYIDLINNNMTVMNQQNGNIIFGTNNGEDMRISSNGNVGIGTTSPDSRLHVFISNTGTIASFVGNGVGGSNYNFDFCASIASGIPSNRIACIDDGAYSGHYGFYSKGAGGALVERMRMASNGNVGIGTQTPQFPLDVNGNIRLGTGTTGNIRFGTSGVGTTQAGYIDLINNNMTVMNQQNGNIIFGTNNGEDMRISSNGNVGIGTQTPQFPLDVNGNIRLGTGTTGNIRFGTSGVGTTQAGYIDLINNNMTVMNQQNGNIIFGTNNGEDMRISSNGNVGIGTTNPVSPLHVFRSTSGTLASFIGNGIGGNNYNFDFCAYLSSQGIPTNRIACIDDGNFSGHYAFYSKNSGADNNPLVERMRMASNGNVGIGTTNPDVALDVIGTIQGYSSTSLANNAPDTSLSHGLSLICAKSGLTRYAMSLGMDNTNGFGYINAAGNGAIQPVCLQTRGGNVGIGLTSPGYQLHLSTNNAAKPGSSTWSISSDIRIKKNVIDADLDICYSICKNLRLRRYTYKDYIGYEDDKNVVGYIAQEVQKVFPKSVTMSKMVLKKKNENEEIIEEEIEDFLSLDVDQINKTLHGAVQKLMNITEQQQTIISNLEARLSILENK